MSNAEATQSAPTTRKGRSPNYPGIDLKLALERAKTLWEQEQHHAAPSAVILKHWGYGPKSGGGSVAYAALKRFGLLEDAGNGRARLTQRAQAILLAEREGRRDEEKIREAALLPTIHKQVWDAHGASLPSDENFQYELITEKGFTPGGATEFISEWKRTLAFAKLAGSGATVSPDAGKTPDDHEPKLTPPATIETERPSERGQDPSGNQHPKPAKRTIQVPYSPTGWALIEAQFPMGESEWDQMLAVLQAMKPGLVAEDS
jgi:hypothetical protein